MSLAVTNFSAPCLKHALCRKPNVAGVGNVLFFSLDKGFAGRVHAGGVERVDVLGAAGGGGTVDEGQEISHDRTHRLVSVSHTGKLLVVAVAERGH